MKKIVIWGVVLLAVLNAMGSSPKPEPEAVTPVEENKPKIVEPRKPIDLQSSSDQQFSKGYGYYDRAIKSNDDRAAAEAARVFEDYLIYYPTGQEKNEVLFFAAKSYGILGNKIKRDIFIERCRTDIPSTNRLAGYVDLEYSTLLLDDSNYPEAKAVLEKLVSSNLYAENLAFKADIKEKLLQVYEYENNVNKQLEIIDFFLQNPDVLKNKNIYYVYAYRAGVMCYERNNKVKAQKYFALVAKEEKNPAITTMATSAKDYLQKINNDSQPKPATNVTKPKSDVQPKPVTTKKQ